MYSSKCNFPTIWNNFETTTLKSLMLTTCQNVSRNPTEIWIFDDVKTICIPLSKIFVLISALLRKKALWKIKSKNYSSIFKHKEPSQGSQKSKSIQTKMLINLCQIKILFSSWKSEIPAEEEKPSRERSEKIKSLSLSHKEMNNHSCYISRASQQSLQPNLSQHTYIKKIVLRVWLQSDWRLLKMQSNSNYFSLSLFLYFEYYPTK